MYKKILVPLSGSHASAAGLHEAIELAQEQRACLRLVHFIDNRAVAGASLGGYGAAELCDTLVKRGKAILELASSLALRQGVEIDQTVCKITRDCIAGAVLGDVERSGVDLIVIGKGEGAGWRNWTNRTVADLIARRARVPVLVVQSKDCLKHIR